MDPKASAKAKRSYSQQGRRNHPSPAAIAQKKKAASAQLRSEGKTQRVHSRGLPSNLYRYDEDEDKAESSSGTTLGEGEIVPKSKGADFSYLIEQARSQQHQDSASTVPESLSFFDDLATDFMKGVSSICAVRRKNLLSLCEDDNFVVDDDLTSSYEIPFLNLDLHAIAAQLSSLKLSERLFIEEDLFPVDHCSDGSKGSSSSSQSEEFGSIEIGENLRTSDSYLYSSPAKNAHNHTADPKASNFPNPNISQPYPAQKNEQEKTVGANVVLQFDKGEAEETPANISKSSASKKVGEAEAELDMLLDSLKQTNISDSKGDLLDNEAFSKISSGESLPLQWRSSAQNHGYVIRKQPEDAEVDMLLDSSNENSLSGFIHGSLLGSSSNSRAPNSDFFYPMHQQSIFQSQSSSKNKMAASIDDSIDDLLVETSQILKMKQKDIRATTPQLGSMVSTTKRSDPDSCSDSIDDLLGGHKFIITQNGVASSKGSSSNLGSEVQVDDFDSWMDSF